MWGTPQSSRTISTCSARASQRARSESSEAAGTEVSQAASRTNPRSTRSFGVWRRSRRVVAMSGEGVAEGEGPAAGPRSGENLPGHAAGRTGAVRLRVLSGGAGSPYSPTVFFRRAAPTSRLVPLLRRRFDHDPPHLD